MLELQASLLPLVVHAFLCVHMYLHTSALNRPLVGVLYVTVLFSHSEYKLDVKTKRSMGFTVILMSLGSSIPSVARTLLRARGIINPVDHIG